MSSFRVERLRAGRDFDEAYKEGRTWVLPGAVMHVRATEGPVVRVGFVAGRRLGSAVERNRAKRLLREAFRRVVGRFHPSSGADLIFVARRRLLEMEWGEVVETVAGLLTRAGMWERGPDG